MWLKTYSINKELLAYFSKSGNILQKTEMLSSMKFRPYPICLRPCLGVHVCSNLGIISQTDAMDNKTSNNSNVLMGVNPDTKDTKLIVNKDIRTLEDLRKNFNPVQSSVLGQVRDFLPKLATANEDLQRKLEADPDYSADIEKLEDAEAPHIEMNLALMEADYSSEDDSVDSDSSSDDSSDDNDDSLMCGEVNENNIKMPKHGNTNKHGKQLIQVVDEDNSNISEGSLNDQVKTPDQGDNT